MIDGALFAAWPFDLICGLRMVAPLSARLPAPKVLPRVVRLLCGKGACLWLPACCERTRRGWQRPAALGRGGGGRGKWVPVWAWHLAGLLLGMPRDSRRAE